MKTTKNKKVLEIAEAIKLSANPESGKKNGRFSENQFLELLPALLADKSYKGVKVIYKAGERFEDQEDFTEGLEKFMHKILKHAGIKNDEERARIIDTFEFKESDVKFMFKVVEEAMYIYTSNGKYVKLFEDKDLSLAFQSFARTGKYEGQMTFKKKAWDKIHLSKKVSGKK